MIKPQDLNTVGVIPRVGARGVDIWRLFTACDRGDAATVAALLRRDRGLATVHYHTDGIKIAVRKGHVDIVRLLLEHGASPSMSYDGSGYTGLRMAAERSHDRCVDMLTSALEAFPVRAEQRTAGRHRRGVPGRRRGPGGVAARRVAHSGERGTRGRSDAAPCSGARGG